MGAPEGLLLIDKPQGVTSHDIVDTVRRSLDTRKVGHAGTLDPMATGLLLVGVGRATRLLRYLSGMDKAYDGGAKLGERTDTLDAEGQVVSTTPVPAELSGERLVEAMSSFLGPISQIPPKYSAVKVGGQTMHKAARKGEELAAPPREVEIEAFDLIGFDPAHATFDFTVTCSGGTYVRTLVADVGDQLEVGAHLIRLRRTRIGPFLLADAVVPDAIGEPLPVEAAVAHLPHLDLSEDEAQAARRGRPLGPAGIGGSYGVYGPDGLLVGVYVDQGAKAVPEMILAPPA